MSIAKKPWTHTRAGFLYDAEGLYLGDMQNEAVAAEAGRAVNEREELVAVVRAMVDAAPGSEMEMAFEAADAILSRIDAEGKT